MSLCRFRRRLPRRGLGISALAAMFVAVLAVPGGAAPDSPGAPPPSEPALACTVPTFQALATLDVTITSASVLATSAPVVSYCRVNGFVTTSGPGLSGGVPTTNHVNFMVSMPDGFNKRYYFVGVGGSAGSVPNPPAARLREGYAVAGSDGGSPTPGVNYAFGFDRTKALDWGSRGVHVATLATQSITRQYYGLGTKKNDLFRYIDGCSGGGRMGVVEASLFPDDYDGVIAGAPGMNTNNILFFGQVAKFLLDNPTAWITPAQITQLSNAVLAQFDGSDGAIDGIVSDYTKIDVDAASLISPPLTALQIQTLNLMLQGQNLFGQTYPGYTLANPIGWASFITGTVSPTQWIANPGTRPASYQVFDSASKGLFGPTFDFTTMMDFGDAAQVNLWHNTWEQTFVGSGTADPTALEGFRRAGGKILFWHGVADNAITVKDTVRYYDELVQDQHSLGRTQTFASLFLVPGVQHCGGGIGATDTATQALDVITQWVEHGQKSPSFVANRGTRSFLLCAYPTRAVFNGGVDNPNGLDVNDASNYTCQTD